MGTIKIQLSEAFKKFEEAVEAIRTLTNKIREDVGDEQSVPFFKSKEEVLKKLFPDGLPLEKLNGELQKAKSKYEGRQMSLRSEIKIGLARVSSLEGELEGVEKKGHRVEEIYKDLFGDMTGAGETFNRDTTGAKNPTEASRVYKDLERAFQKPLAKEDKDNILA